MTHAKKNIILTLGTAKWAPYCLENDFLAALRRVVKNQTFSCLIKKPNKPKKAKDLRLQLKHHKDLGFCELGLRVLEKRAETPWKSHLSALKLKLEKTNP